MEDAKISPEESLQLIEGMINTAKNRFSENGHMYLVWGWTVFICSLAQFVLLHFYNYPKHYIVWLLSLVVFAYSFFYVSQKHKKVKVQTWADSIVAFIWVTFSIVIFLEAFVIGMFTSGDYYVYITPIILAVYGMPIFLSGIVLRFKPLIWGGVACWLLCVGSLFIEAYDYKFLMIPAAMLVAWIIPGYLLRLKYKSSVK
jgi:hypothetical protein